MKSDELALIWFDYNNYSFNLVEKFLKNFDNIEQIFDKNALKNAFFKENELNEISKKLLELNVSQFEKTIEDELSKHNIFVVTYVSENFPLKLKNIPDPPLVLYAKGDLSLLSKKSISIVGTRRPTTYGKIVCEKFTKELSSAGLVTVSGLAYGIDTLVASTTLSAGGKTIAVLAGGLNKIYPSQNSGLAEKIVETGGLLLSEQRISVEPLGFMFLSRNRIVSALGLGTVIIEAGKTSGTMTTARLAIEQGRELFVVPGNITSAMSEGTNMLIDEIPDVFTISPSRILFRLGIKKHEAPRSEKQIELMESQILSELSNGELSFDDLAQKLGIEASVLSSKLIKMEMFGLIKKGDGNLYYKM